MSLTYPISKLLADAHELDIDELVRRTITVKLLIETNNDLDGVLSVEKSSMDALPHPVPEMWTTYGSFCDNIGFDTRVGTAHCGRNTLLLHKNIKRKVTGETERRKWETTLKFMVPPEGWEAGFNPLVNPLAWPVVYLSDTTNYNTEIDFDANGSAIINPAKDPYYPPVTKDDGRPVLIAIKNMWPLDDIIQIERNYKDALNADTFHGAPPGTCKIESIKKGPLQTGCLNGQTINYYPVAFRIQFLGTAIDGFGTGTGSANNDDWDERRVKRGWQIMKDGVKQYPRTDAGTGTARGEFLDNVNLSDDGTKLPDGEEPRTQRITKYRRKTFAYLGI